MNNLKLISINIEGDKHFSRVMPFLKSQNPDVICIQEALDKDVEYLKSELQMDGQYFPTTIMPEGNRGGLAPNTQWGVLVLYKSEPLDLIHDYYVQHSESLPVFDNDNVNSTNRVLVGIVYEKDGKRYQIFTTHFTWTYNGEPDQYQRDHLQRMLTTLDQYEEVILCGDFNAPRGKEIWNTLAQRYTDNIPTEVTTTIDQNLHKVKGLQFVVDGLFSTDHYTVENVTVTDEVSDHMAISALIFRK